MWGTIEEILREKKLKVENMVAITTDLECNMKDAVRNWNGLECACHLLALKDALEESGHQLKTLLLSVKRIVGFLFCFLECSCDL